MIKIVCNICILLIMNSSIYLSEIIPYARSSSIFISSSFNLICSCSYTKNETIRILIICNLTISKILSALLNCISRVSEWKILALNICECSVPFLVYSVNELVIDFLSYHSSLNLWCESS
jgi:hypothetical protein